MKRGSIIGYDLNENTCQISYYNEKNDEPKTLEFAPNESLIPLKLGYKDEQWVYGREAEELELEDGICVVSDLFKRAVSQKKVRIGEKVHDAVWLLAKFIGLTLEDFEDIRYITFSTPYTTIDLSKMLRGIGRHLGIDKENIYVQDYKEGFCQYMFYQPKELWQYESAMFFCDGQTIKAYMLRRMNVANGQNRDMFVTVDEVASAKIQEMEAIYPVLNREKARSADESFRLFIQNVFEKKVVSSVYLTGAAFENKWYPNSLKVLCNGRRAFVGNNLYSKGACYTAMRRYRNYNEGPVYLDDTRMTEQISLRMRVGGKEGWYPIVAWGTHWYEADGQWEVILEDTSDIEIHVETLAGDDLQVEKVSLEGLEERRDYSLRLRIEVMFLDEKTCKMIFQDVGFGEFFKASDFRAEKVIHLGGINGQFNSMS